MLCCSQIQGNNSIADGDDAAVLIPPEIAIVVSEPMNLQ